MERTFRKAKMLARLEKEGRMNEVTQADLDLMTELDGLKGSDYNWRSFVYGDNLVWIERDGKNGAYVCAEDCD